VVVHVLDVCLISKVLLTLPGHSSHSINGVGLCCQQNQHVADVCSNLHNHTYPVSLN
jgi:hypothetical protein